ncbi:uL15 family ribosomal protein [Candidatus Nomurabacteria bacterium]|nr:uL15 family ribosomal protein [Candidatus Nomurabacteria bacterium]
MQMNQIKRNTPRKKSIQVGRGGKRGKTSGRGHKGQHQHGGHGIRPDIRDLIKKLPKLRGRGKHGNTSIQTKPEVVNVSTLDTLFNVGDVVSPNTLFEKKLVKRQGGKIPAVKILGNGELSKKLSIENCIVSAPARAKIEAAGGAIVVDSK